MRTLSRILISLLLSAVFSASMKAADAAPLIEASADEVTAGTKGSPYYISPRRLATAIAGVEAGSLDIDALTAATEADLAGTDPIVISDGGTEKKITLENFRDYLQTLTWTFSDATATYANDADPAGTDLAAAMADKLDDTDDTATNTTLKAASYTRAAHGGTAVGATETVAAADGNYHELIFDENVVITTTFNAASGAYQSLLIKGIQDANGTNTVTLSPVPSNGQPLVDPTANAVTYLTVETTDGGTTTTVTSSVQLTHIVAVFDPDAVCDGSQDIVPIMYVGDDFPSGVTFWKWRVSFGADPTTEADLDLKRADAYIGLANSAVMDVLDTTNGAATESTYSNINSGAKVANGKVVYLEFGTAYTATGEKITFEAWVF